MNRDWWGCSHADKNDRRNGRDAKHAFENDLIRYPVTWAGTTPRQVSGVGELSTLAYPKWLTPDAGSFFRYHTFARIPTALFLWITDPDQIKEVSSVISVVIYCASSASLTSDSILSFAAPNFEKMSQTLADSRNPWSRIRREFRPFSWGSNNSIKEKLSNKTV